MKIKSRSGKLGHVWLSPWRTSQGSQIINKVPKAFKHSHLLYLYELARLFRNRACKNDSLDFPRTSIWKRCLVGLGITTLVISGIGFPGLHNLIYPENSLLKGSENCLLLLIKKREEEEEHFFQEFEKCSSSSSLSLSYQQCLSPFEQRDIYAKIPLSLLPNYFFLTFGRQPKNFFHSLSLQTCKVNIFHLTKKRTLLKKERDIRKSSHLKIKSFLRSKDRN